jgi:hypothetical protein
MENNLIMSEFSQKRFVDLGQTLYVNMLSRCEGMGGLPEEERRKVFALGAQMAFEATEEFAKVFRHQEEEVI